MTVISEKGLIFIEEQSLKMSKFLEDGLDVVLIELLVDLASMPDCIEMHLDYRLSKEVVLDSDINTDYRSLSVNLILKI